VNGIGDFRLRPDIHAHRGASSECPENTMAAFIKARELEADAIEFDVHMTSDGVPVVIHDYDLARTTSGVGYVYEQTVENLRALDAGLWFGERFAGERIPVLEEVLSLEGIDFELEVKGVPSLRFIDALVTEVKNAGVEGRVEFTSFHIAAMPQLRGELPLCRLGLFPQELADWMTIHLYEEILVETAKTGSFNVVHVPPVVLRLLDRDRFEEAGLRLHSWNPATSEELTMVLERSDQFSTSDIERAITARNFAYRS
jgi:glycerophosphoryl diester phosphodiesterase